MDMSLCVNAVIKDLTLLCRKNNIANSVTLHCDFLTCELYCTDMLEILSLWITAHWKTLFLACLVEVNMYFCVLFAEYDWL